MQKREIAVEIQDSDSDWKLETDTENWDERLSEAELLFGPVLGHLGHVISSHCCSLTRARAAHWAQGQCHGPPPQDKRVASLFARPRAAAAVSRPQARRGLPLSDLVKSCPVLIPIALALSAWGGP